RLPAIRARVRARLGHRAPDLGVRSLVARCLRPEDGPPLSQRHLRGVGDVCPRCARAPDHRPLSREVLDAGRVAREDDRSLLPAHLGIGDDDVTPLPSPEDASRTSEREAEYLLATPQKPQFRHPTAPPYVIWTLPAGSAGVQRGRTVKD